jgi:3-oxoacyl-[acyl-carrier-protein] synthase II
MKMSNNNRRRVVVTGLGVISSLGIGWQEFWKNIMAGKSGISPVTAFDTSAHSCHNGGEVRNFDPNQFMHRQRAQKIGRASQMAIAASKLALKDAKMNYRALSKHPTAVTIGTTGAEINLLERFNNIRIGARRRFLDNYYFPAGQASSLSGNVSLELNLNGENSVFTTACASGNYAVGYAADLIRMGRVDFALSGGAEAFSRIVYTGFCRLLNVSADKCRPFDKNRAGMIPSEGAGVVFLETLESALKRKAPIYAEILGYGMSCNADNMIEPAIKSISNAIQKARKDAAVGIDEVDYISAHGTGTKANDRAECAAIYEVFGKRAKAIPISSIKSMLGHTMGASAALETIACCLAIKNNEVPPTINYVTKDPECAIDCVPNKGRKHRVKIALNNSHAFGGDNACLVMEEYRDAR